MAKRKALKPSFTKAELEAALSSCYPDSRFLTGNAVDPSADFRLGLVTNRSEFVSRSKVMRRVQQSEWATFPRMPDFPEHIVVSAHCFIWETNIVNSQIMPETRDVEEFTHVIGRANPHYDIYYRIDFEKKTITFKLGNLEQTLVIIEHSNYVWKPVRKQILCMSAEQLDRDFKDDFWDSIPISIGRRVLGIPNHI